MKRRHHRQSGYALIVILLLLVLLLIAAGAVAPSIAQQIKRDREDELIHRGTAYARAIRHFYKKFGRYPNSISELENTNHLRFLRRRYTDPMTGKDDWRLIHVGEAKPVPMGFFGGKQNSQSNAFGTPIGQPPGSPSGTSASTSMGTPVSSMGIGPTFGGGPIVGVASSSTRTAIKERNGMTTYDQWEFVYDPRLETPGGAPGAPVNPNQPGGAANSAPPPGQQPQQPQYPK